MSVQVYFPQVKVVDDDGYFAQEWQEWLQNPQVLSIVFQFAIGVESGGTGLASGTPGGVLAFTGPTTIASSAALAAHALVIGGGGGVPSTPVALGTVSTVLHGNAAGDPSFGFVNLTSDVTGILPAANGGAGGTAPTTSSLGADVPLNNTANYFDGPNINVGTGTWFVSGTVSVLDTAGVAGMFCKLWDGTTLIASAVASTGGANFVQAITLSGYITSPAAALRISVRDVSSVSGKIVFNSSGNSLDSTITAFRIFI